MINVYFPCVFDGFYVRSVKNWLLPHGWTVGRVGRRQWCEGLRRCGWTGGRFRFELRGLAKHPMKG